MLIRSADGRFWAGEAWVSGHSNARVFERADAERVARHLRIQYPGVAITLAFGVRQ